MQEVPPRPPQQIPQTQPCLTDMSVRSSARESPLQKVRLVGVAAIVEQLELGQDILPVHQCRPEAPWRYFARQQPQHLTLEKCAVACGLVTVQLETEQPHLLVVASLVSEWAYVLADLMNFEKMTAQAALFLKSAAFLASD